MQFCVDQGCETFFQQNLAVVCPLHPTRGGTLEAVSSPTADSVIAETPASPAEETAVPAAPAAPAPAPAAGISESLSPLEALGGLQVTSVTLVPAGAAIDVRYRITSKERASSLGDHGDTAVLIDEATGTSIPVLTQLSGPRVSAKTRAMSAKMSGQLNGFPPATALERAEGQLCSILVPNPGGVVRRGGRVSLRVGHLLAGNLPVQ